MAISTLIEQRMFHAHRTRNRGFDTGSSASATPIVRGMNAGPEGITG